MDFLKKKLSMNTDPDKDKEEKTSANNLLESFSNKRASLWSDFTSKINNKSDRTTPDGSSEVDAPVAAVPTSKPHTKPPLNGLAFMETVKQKLQSVRLLENGSENGGSLRGEPECAPLIDTGDNSSQGDSDHATWGESEAGAVTITINGEEKDVRRKKFGKRQDSFTAEEIYLDTVAAQVRCGLNKPDDNAAALVSPSKAVAEFAFGVKDSKTSIRKVKRKSSKSSVAEKNTLQVGNGNLINFDSIQNLSKAASSAVETIVHHEDDGVFDYESSGEESSEPVYSEFASQRSNSLDSINSLDDSYEDEESKELKSFAEKFACNIFTDENNSNEDKARFGKCVQDGNFRLTFARAISEKRSNRAVTEHTFYQLVQYFAVVLFECDEADDFSPAMILMNMCFTFYYEAMRAGQVEQNYLSTYLKNQPIWQSMRYWNAAFYEAVQKERMRKPLTTNMMNSRNGSHMTSPLSEASVSGDPAAAADLTVPRSSSNSDRGKDDLEEEHFDRKFQENIIFGQLGTFLHNMRAFGLNIEWCLEFLRKQSTIGNLSEEQTEMLRESMQAVFVEK